MIYFLITLPSCIQLSPIKLSHSHLEHSNFYNEIQTALLLYPPAGFFLFYFYDRILPDKIMKGTLNMDISNMNNIESRVQSYWTKRAHNFNIVRKNELNSSISERWREEIVHFLPEGKVLQILDVGTGTGYFAILLSQIGHQVTGIDLTDAMLKEACDNAALYQVHPTFQQMDAQKLAFLDQSFDVVISRNLTWTLPDPESAYREWMRVLKKGGILLNFDADYASNVRNQNTSASHISDTEVYGHCGVTPELEQENASITLSMPMSRKQRPYWDQEFLENIGFSRSGYDLSVGQNILKEHDLKDAPMFLVWGVR